MDKSIYISRPDAATQLGVSLRTLDRYVKSKGLHTKREGKSLLFRASDIESIMPSQIQHSELMGSMADEAEMGSAVASFMQEPVTHSAEMELRTIVNALQHQVTNKEHKIELLSYKLGVMETKLAQSVPMQDFVDMQIKTSEKNSADQANFLNVTYLYKRTKFLKNVYAGLVVAAILGGIFFITTIVK